MNAVFDRLRDLELQIQSMSHTASPAELFKAMREACCLAAPRGAVFLVRQGRIQGWSSHGYDAEAAEAQRRFSCGLNEGWLGELAAIEQSTASTRPADAGGPEFGQAVAHQTVGSAVRIQGKPIALLLAERQEGETPWHPELLGSLVTVARLRLELDLAQRRMAGTSETQPTEKSTEPQVTHAADPAPVHAAQASPVEAEREPSRQDETAALEPAPAPAPEGQADLEAARKYARLVATDIRLYNEEAVVLGRRNGDLGIRLEEHLDRGKETFLRRHGDLGPTGLDLLHEAYVQVLAAGDPALIPESVTH